MPDKTGLELIGLTQAELQERVIEKIAEGFLDRDGEESCETMLAIISGKLHKHSTEHIDATIRALAEEHVLPHVSRYVEEITIQGTNEWGEKRGEPKTFVEYLVHCAKSYLQEKVNHNGKTKAEDSYGWDGKQTRIVHLVHQHLQYSIERAMKGALKTVNAAIAEGVAETVKMKIAEVTEKLNVSVKI